MKKLIPAALLLAAFGAHAQATVYGLIDLNYSKSIADDLASPKGKADFHSGGDGGGAYGNSSTRFGIKGSNDVGSGIKANFKLETGGIGIDGKVNDNGNFFNRAAWAGFSGTFGEVRLGRQDNVPFQTFIDFDFNGAANIASAYASSGVAAWGANLGRQSRSLQYINTFGALKVQAGFVPEGNTVDPTAKAVYSGGATYTVNKLIVAAAVQTKSTSAGKDFGAIGATYDLGVAKVAATYTDGGVKANRGLGLGVTATVANGVNVGAQLGRNADKTTGIELFVNKEVLKNTYAYFDFGNLENKSGPSTVKGTGFATGFIYTF